MIAYLDTSAAFKLLVEERESIELADYVDLQLERGSACVSSWLLHTELHCASDRQRSIYPEAVAEILGAVELIDLERIDLQRAATSAWGLRSADAMHLATALRVEADEFISYDVELMTAAARAGLTIRSPGAARPR